MAPSEEPPPPRPQTKVTIVGKRGKSGRAIFGTPTFGPQTPLPFSYSPAHSRSPSAAAVFLGPWRVWDGRAGALLSAKLHPPPPVRHCYSIPPPPPPVVRQARLELSGGSTPDLLRPPVRHSYSIPPPPPPHRD